MKQKFIQAIMLIWQFGLVQLRSVVFAGSFFALLALSHYVTIPGIYRYDFLFLGAIVLQILMIVFRLETWRELLMIFLFHIVGLGLEVFKTLPEIASWSYPEPSIFHIANVPLYSGFMYAAIGSYIAQSWRNFKLQFANFPNRFVALLLAIMIYANFFTHHFAWDTRYVLLGLVVILFARTIVTFAVGKKRYRMPLVVSFGLIGFFIWIAENIGTFYGAWLYPDQRLLWSIVSFHKILAWSLLVILSFILVAYLKRVTSPVVQDTIS